MDIRLIKPEETVDIRHKVLWPDMPKSFCLLEDDSAGIHYGGFINDKLICVASIFIENSSARLRKFATLPDFQNSGYGSKMLKYIIQKLERDGISRFWCDARESATDFYKRFNMSINGATFYKKDVRYVVMERFF